MDVAAELNTSSDHWVWCSRRMTETSTVTPSHNDYLKSLYNLPLMRD